MSSKGVNKCIIVGNCGKDPEMKYMPNGNAVTNISIATSESWKDKQTGQQQSRTEWHNIVFFNRLAEIAGEYLKKGGKVYIEGALRTRKWQDKESGQDRYSTEIVANEMQMLDSKGDSLSNGPHGDDYQNRNQPKQAPAQRPAPQPQYAPQAPQQAAPQQYAQQPPQGQTVGAHTQQPQQPQGFDDFEDQIPF